MKETTFIRDRWALYSRVSKDEQNSKQQTELLRDYAKKRGWKEWVCFVDHGYKRDSVNRPQFNKMVEYIKDGTYFDGICVQRCDRITSVLKTAIEFWEILTEKKIKLITVYEGEFRFDSGDDYFRFMMSTLLSEREKRILIERTLIGVARAKAEGKYKGGKKGRKSWAKNQT